MTNSKQERAARRLIILEGLNNGLSKEKIAEKLGVEPFMVRRDLKRMMHGQDQELKRAQNNAIENALAEKNRISNRSTERLMRITGMTFQEQTFSNMMSFYGPEIRKIMRAKDQDVAISALSGSVVRTLKRNKIIGSGSRGRQVTQKARNYLLKSHLMKR